MTIKARLKFLWKDIYYSYFIQKFRKNRKDILKITRFAPDWYVSQGRTLQKIVNGVTWNMGDIDKLIEKVRLHEPENETEEFVYYLIHDSCPYCHQSLFKNECLNCL